MASLAASSTSGVGSVASDMIDAKVPVVLAVVHVALAVVKAHSGIEYYPSSSSEMPSTYKKLHYRRCRGERRERWEFLAPGVGHTAMEAVRVVQTYWNLLLLDCGDACCIRERGCRV